MSCRLPLPDSFQTVGLYQLLFRDGDLRIRVEDQVAEGDRVVSRWVADGHNRGRPLRLWGITISHVASGEIVEDWSAADNLDVLRQLGPRRLLLLGIDGCARGAPDSQLRPRVRRRGTVIAGRPASETAC